MENQVSEIENLTFLQINTDGITVRIKKEDVDKYYDICNNWEKMSKLGLEYVNYSKMIIADVNVSVLTL